MRLPAFLAASVLLPLTATMAAPVTPEAQPLADRYMEFLDRCRTEVEATDFIREAAEDAGFRNLESIQEPLQPGSKVYLQNHDRAIILAVTGRRPIADGLHLVATHIDSPRLDLKAQPVYDSQGFFLLQTHTYGGIKRYQWVNTPLQLHGVWYDPDGRRHHVIIGDDPGEPTFLIPDLEPHLSRNLNERSAADAIGAEEVDPIVGMVTSTARPWNKPDAEPAPEAPKDEFLAMLRPYLGGADLSPTAIATGEFHLVPATEPRYLGLDRSMIAAYGQDDRSNAYCAVRALLDMDGVPEYAALGYHVGQEEIGSGNNTGAASTFLTATIARLLEHDPRSPVSFGDNLVRRTLTRSWVLSADTPPAVNPIYSDVWEHGNSLKLGQGVGVIKWGAGRDANPEYFAKVAAILDGAGVRWQVAPLGRNGAGGGGTIGGFMSEEGMEVLDLGITLLSMHSPYEVCSVNDLWEGYRAFAAFYACDRRF